MAPTNCFLITVGHASTLPYPVTDSSPAAHSRRLPTSSNAVQPHLARNWNRNLTLIWRFISNSLNISSRIFFLPPHHDSPSTQLEAYMYVLFNFMVQWNAVCMFVEPFTWWHIGVHSCMNVCRNTAAACIHDHLYQSIHDDDGGYDGDKGDDDNLLCMHVCMCVCICIYR